jgi:hypothetical protein
MAHRYNGREADPPEVFPNVIEEACTYVENIVHDELRKRHRFALEWDGQTTSDTGWYANVAACLVYEGGKDTISYVRAGRFGQ